MGAVKAMKRKDDWSSIPGSCITCTRCGKLYQKSLGTQSVIMCPRCGNREFTYLRNNILLQFPAVMLEAENAWDHLGEIDMALQSFAAEPVKDYVPAEI